MCRTLEQRVINYWIFEVLLKFFFLVVVVVVVVEKVLLKC